MKTELLTLSDARAFVETFERAPPSEEGARRQAEAMLWEMYEAFPELELTRPLAQLLSKVEASPPRNSEIWAVRSTRTSENSDGQTSRTADPHDGDDRRFPLCSPIRQENAPVDDDGSRPIWPGLPNTSGDLAGWDLPTLVRSAKRRLTEAALPRVPPHSGPEFLAVLERTSRKIGRLPASAPSSFPTPRRGLPKPSDRLRLAEWGSYWLGSEAGEFEWLSAMDVGAAGERRDNAIHAKLGVTGHIVSGPYFQLAAGIYRARIRLHAELGRLSLSLRRAKRNREVVLEVVVDNGRDYLIQIGLGRLQLRQPEQLLEFEITPEFAHSRRPGVELRIWTNGSFRLTVFSIKVSKVR